MLSVTASLPLKKWSEWCEENVLGPWIRCIYAGICSISSLINGKDRAVLLLAFQLRERSEWATHLNELLIYHIYSLFHWSETNESWSNDRINSTEPKNCLANRSQFNATEFLPVNKWNFDSQYSEKNLRCWHSALVLNPLVSWEVIELFGNCPIRAFGNIRYSS